MSPSSLNWYNLQLHIPARKVAFVGVRGEGNTLDRLDFLGGTFGNDLSKSSYSDRIFVVLDKTHSVRLARIEHKGVKKTNIVVLSKNGIEYYYPKDLLAA